MGGRSRSGGTACGRPLGRGPLAPGCAGSTGTRASHGPSGRRWVCAPGVRGGPEPAGRACAPPASPGPIASPCRHPGCLSGRSSRLGSLSTRPPPGPCGVPRARRSREAAPRSPALPALCPRLRPWLWKGTRAVGFFGGCYPGKNLRPPQSNLHSGRLQGGRGRPQVRAGA